jgi:hypothetical protein
MRASVASSPLIICRVITALSFSVSSLAHEVAASIVRLTFEFAV